MLENILHDKQSEMAKSKITAAEMLVIDAMITNLDPELKDYYAKMYSALTDTQNQSAIVYVKRVAPKSDFKALMKSVFSDYFENESSPEKSESS